MKEKTPVTNEPLGTHELLDLFKHWDSAVAAKENLYVPIALAAFPALAVAWKDITSVVVAIVAGASILLYWYHLLVIHRVGQFQDRIFELLRVRHTHDVDRIVNPPNRPIGVRRLRNVGLPVLALLWMFMIYAKFDAERQAGGPVLSTAGLIVVAALLIVATPIAAWVLRPHTKRRSSAPAA